MLIKVGSIYEIKLLLTKTKITNINIQVGNM